MRFIVLYFDNFFLYLQFLLTFVFDIPDDGNTIGRNM